MAGVTKILTALCWTTQCAAEPHDLDSQRFQSARDLSESSSVGGFYLATRFFLGLVSPVIRDTPIILPIPWIGARQRLSGAAHAVATGTRQSRQD
jgi:hypothetical protein